MNYHIHMRFPEGRAKALTFSYDDGVKEDIRLVEILNRHGMKGTFNLNSGMYASEDEKDKTRRLTRETITELFANGPHEVACHAYTHPFLESLPPATATYQIIRDRTALEEQFGTIIRGMAYPYGTYSDGVVDCLKACGILYSRTVISTERFDLPNDWLRLPATCHHNNPRLMELARSFVEKEIHPHHPCKLFYLWGHSYEFDDNDNWNVIEEFTDYMGGREADIWYATNMEIFEYMDDFRKIIRSADGRILYNPTARTLWFLRQKELFTLEPGQTLVLK